MSQKLKIMCWNIAEGSNDRRLPPDAALPLIAEQIREKSPDIVLLNEARNSRGWPFGSGINQIKRLAELTRLPYCHWGNTVPTGLTGWKAVGVLSRYPLGSAYLHKVRRQSTWGPIIGSGETTYGTLETSTMVNNILLHIFSTRFDHNNAMDRMAGMEQGSNMVLNLEPSVAVIFGGDFNEPPYTPDLGLFRISSGLNETFLDHPDQEPCFLDKNPNNRVDYIFYRGPYRVEDVQYRCPWSGGQEISDHPWVYAELVQLAGT